MALHRGVMLGTNDVTQEISVYIGAWVKHSLVREFNFLQIKGYTFLRRRVI